MTEDEKKVAEVLDKLAWKDCIHCGMPIRKRKDLVWEHFVSGCGGDVTYYFCSSYYEVTSKEANRFGGLQAKP